MRSLQATLALAAMSFTFMACQAEPPPKAPPPPTWMSYRDALITMCDVDKLAGLQGEPDSLVIGQKRTAFINQKVDNPDAIELRTLMSVKDAKTQAKMLREEAAEAKLKQCALADTLAQGELGGITP